MQQRRRFDWNRFDRALDACFVLMWLAWFGMIAVILVLAALAGCSASKPTPPNVADVKLVNVAPASVGAARQAIALLFATCPEFGKYKNDIMPGSMQAEFALVPTHTFGINYRRERYGWPGFIEVTLALKDGNISVPARFHAQGHTLYFFLGGGRHPGIEILKPFEVTAAPGVRICGRVKTTPRDVHVFIPVAGMSVVDNVR